MNKFKIGDRVVCSEISRNGVPAGSQGIIVEDDNCPYVQWDEYEISAIHENKLKLISPSVSNQLYTNADRPKTMTQAQYLAFVERTFADMLALTKSKNSDYANSDDAFANFTQANEFGVDTLTGLAIRMNDKMQRLKSFCKKGELQVKTKGDTVADIFKDLAIYSVIAQALLSLENTDAS